MVVQILLLCDSGMLAQVKEEGWLAQHILIRSQGTNELLACVPMYLKFHSYGEYVFDNSWAMLASRLGQRYYVSCVWPLTSRTLSTSVSEVLESPVTVL